MASPCRRSTPTAGSSVGRGNGGADTDDLQVVGEASLLLQPDQPRDLVVAMRTPMGEEDDHHRPALRRRGDRRPVEALADEHRRGHPDGTVVVGLGEWRQRRPLDGDRKDLAVIDLGERARRSRRTIG